MSTQVIGVVLALAVVCTMMFLPLKPASDEQGQSSRAGAAMAWRWGGTATGAILGLVVAVSMGLGRGLLLAAPIFSLGVVLGVVLGELRVPHAVGPVRRAALETRSVRDYLPRWPAVFVAVAGVAELVLLSWTTSMGSSDDLGRAGRALTHVCGDMTTSKSPWPGSFYSKPLGAAVVLGLLLAGIGLWRVVGRPRPVDRSGELVQDDQSRRLSATSLTGACGVLITVPLLGASLVTAASLLSMPCAPSSWKVIGWALLVLSAGWFALFVWSVRAILVPSGQSRANRIAV